MKIISNLVLVVVFSIFIFSCQNTREIEKRKYRPGWFADFSSDKIQLNNTDHKKDSVSVIQNEKKNEKANVPQHSLSPIRKAGQSISVKISKRISAHPQ